MTVNNYSIPPLVYSVNQTSHNYVMLEQFMKYLRTNNSNIHGTEFKPVKILDTIPTKSDCKKTEAHRSRVKHKIQQDATQNHIYFMLRYSIISSNI